MIGVQFDSGETAEAVQWAAFQRGLLVLEAGDNAVRMSPPLVVTADEVDTAVRLFGDAVDAVERIRSVPTTKHIAGDRADDTYVDG